VQVDAAADEALPASHSEHSTAPATEYSPARQLVHEAAASRLRVEVPAAQLMHEEEAKPE
jgi:hypothetical protein